MCNLSDMVWERGIQKTILTMYKNGMGIEEIVKYTDIDSALILKWIEECDQESVE